MSLRLLILLVGLFAYLSATGGAMVFCTSAQGTRAIELAVAGARCADPCGEGTAEWPNEPPSPKCVDEVLDLGDVRTVASAPIAFPSLNVLCGLLPTPPVLRSLQFEERENDPPQHLALVATVVLVI